MTKDDSEITITTVVTEDASSPKTDTELILEKIAQLEQIIKHKIGPFTTFPDPADKPQKAPRQPKVSKIGPFSSPPDKPPKSGKYKKAPFTSETKVVTTVVEAKKESDDSWW